MARGYSSKLSLANILNSVSSPSFDGQDSITVNVTAGQTYYLKGEIKWGWPAGRTKFSSMPESSGQAELAKIK